MVKRSTHADTVASNQEYEGVTGVPEENMHRYFLPSGQWSSDSVVQRYSESQQCVYGEVVQGWSVTTSQ